MKFSRPHQPPCRRHFYQCPTDQHRARNTELLLVISQSIFSRFINSCTRWRDI